MFPYENMVGTIFEYMVDLVYGKWFQFIKWRLKLSCLVEFMGECFLDDDAELASLFSLLQDSFSTMTIEFVHSQ